MTKPGRAPAQSHSSRIHRVWNRLRFSGIRIYKRFPLTHYSPNCVGTFILMSITSLTSTIDNMNTITTLLTQQGGGMAGKDGGEEHPPHRGNSNNAQPGHKILKLKWTKFVQSTKYISFPIWKSKYLKSMNVWISIQRWKCLNNLKENDRHRKSESRYRI